MSDQTWDGEERRTDHSNDNREILTYRWLAVILLGVVGALIWLGFQMFGAFMLELRAQVGDNKENITEMQMDINYIKTGMTTLLQESKQRTFSP